MENTDYDLIILGAGPAGLTAGLYASRSKLKTLILDEAFGGGQLALTHEIANYPGVETMGGFELAELMKKQTGSFGCEFKTGVEVTGYDIKGNIKTLELDGEKKVTAKTFIIAVGGKPRTLGIPSEEKFKGRGISYCATCDGPFFRDKNVIAIGGGNSALEEGAYLTNFAKSVTIVHRSKTFNAQPIAVEEARSKSNMSFLMNTEVKEFLGEKKVEKAVLYNNETKTESVMDIEGAFIFIGYVPNTKPFEGILEMNKWGELIADVNMNTNIPGVFVAGDAREKKYRQVVNACADGCIAALEAYEYIQKAGHS